MIFITLDRWRLWRWCWGTVLSRFMNRRGQGWFILWLFWDRQLTQWVHSQRRDTIWWDCFPVRSWGNSCQFLENCQQKKANSYCFYLSGWPRQVAGSCFWDRRWAVDSWFSFSTRWWVFFWRWRSLKVACTWYRFDWLWWISSWASRILLLLFSICTGCICIGCRTIIFRWRGRCWGRRWRCGRSRLVGSWSCRSSIGGGCLTGRGILFGRGLFLLCFGGIWRGLVIGLLLNLLCIFTCLCLVWGRRWCWLFCCWMWRCRTWVLYCTAARFWRRRVGWRRRGWLECMRWVDWYFCLRWVQGRWGDLVWFTWTDRYRWWYSDLRWSIQHRESRYYWDTVLPFLCN